MIEKIKKYEWPIFIIFINIFILIFLKTSPLYNGITIGEGDHNIYHIISRQMLNGKILYKDVFDHKGPFIFFIHYIANLFKNYNLIYFLTDTLFLNTIFILNKKTINIKSNNIISYSLIMIEMFLIIFCGKIVNPEMIMLLTISYLNYWILSNKYKNPTIIQLIICGILTGLIFWIKFNLGVYIAIIYFYFIYTHIKNKTFNIKHILYPLIGFLIPTSIVFGYFIYNSALNELFNTYFFINSGYKHQFEKTPINIIILSSITLIILLISIKNKKEQTNILLIGYILLIISSFLISKMNFQYYYTPFISMINIIPHIININKIKIFKYINICLIIFLVFTLFIWNSNTLAFNNSSKLINQDIKTQENISLFFHSDGIILTEINDTNYKYPITPNLTYEQNPEMWNTYYNDTLNKNLEYIIIMEQNNEYKYTQMLGESEKTKEIIKKIYSNIKENYTKEKSYPTGIPNVEYVLYKRK